MNGESDEAEMWFLKPLLLETQVYKTTMESIQRCRDEGELNDLMSSLRIDAYLLMHEWENIT